MNKLISGAKTLGITITHKQQAQFATYYRLLVKWNRRINLTRIVEWNEVQTKHFLDSLTVASMLPPETLYSGNVLDVGTGAGFPGLPLKIVFPGIKLALLESATNKAVFLKHLTDELCLPDVVIYNGRAEDLGHNTYIREYFDAVVSRAVARSDVLAELTLPFCRLYGITVFQKASGVEPEVNEAKVAIKELGGELVKIQELSVRRVLVVVKKISTTLHKYPRRSGIPAKRPIGKRRKAS